jgi:His-Xaa-Ser system radical SAM maturase HxsB
LNVTLRYAPVALPFRTRSLPDQSRLGISRSGDHAFLSDSELQALAADPSTLPLQRQAALKSRFFLGANGSAPGTLQLLRSRQAARRETVLSGPALHLIVPTLQCAHSCRYCQVSRSLDDTGHTMSLADLDKACDAIFESSALTLTVEFQGGDPLLRFDLVQHAMLRISKRNETEGRTLQFVVASTLHQLSEAMCDFFRDHQVFLSTSIDGPAVLHNKNRPTPTRNAYERTVAGIERARLRLGPDAVSALMTTTKESLHQPEAIVDEYVRLGFRDIFLRPLSSYGFAKRNQALLGYTLENFKAFYRRGLERVLYWNRQGVALREVYASILLNKMLCTFDAGYVDLQSPSGAGLSVLVYNYDGFVYPSDEARMLAETGDRSLRMGRIGESLASLQASPVQRELIRASLVELMPACRDCAYNLFCAPNPVDAQAQFGTAFAPVEATEHCQRHLWLFDEFFVRLREADDCLLDLFYRWAQPRVAHAALPQQEGPCAV